MDELMEAINADTTNPMRIVDAKWQGTTLYGDLGNSTQFIATVPMQETEGAAPIISALDQHHVRWEYERPPITAALAGIFGVMILPIVLLLLFYFFLIRPAQMRGNPVPARWVGEAGPYFSSEDVANIKEIKQELFEIVELLRTAANTDLRPSAAQTHYEASYQSRKLDANIEQRLLWLAETSEAEDRFLNGMASTVLEQSEIPLNGALRFVTADSEARFDRAKLALAPEVVLKRALRFATQMMGGPMDSSQMQRVASGIQEGNQGSVTTEGGVLVEWDSEKVDIRRFCPPT